MTAAEDQNVLREALARVFYKIRSGFIEVAGRQTGAFENQDCAWWWDADALIAGPLASLIADRASIRAAEAEIASLREGMEAAVGALEKIAVNDPVCSVCDYPDDACSHPHWLCGRGSLDCPETARQALATLSPKEHPHG